MTSAGNGITGGVQSLLSGLLEVIRERYSATAVDVFSYDPNARHLVTVAWSGTTPSGSRDYRFPAGTTLAGRVALEHTPITSSDVGSDEVASPRLRASNLRSVAAIPLDDKEGDVIGVLQVACPDQREFSALDLLELQRHAAEVARTIRARLTEDDRAAAEALQRSLLPSGPPSIKGLDLGARFVPGEGGVSGDWYDVFELPTGSVGVVMGDVAGHGLMASVVMGRLKSALRAYALEHDDPAEVLSRLDRKIQHFESGVMATALYAVGKPPFQVFEVACAGHPMPLLAQPGRGVYQVEINCDPPLGVDFARPREVSLLDLDADSSLVFFTDGLVERRRPTTDRGRRIFSGIDDAIDELATVVETGDADRASGRILDHMLTLEPPQDDVAVLVLRREPTS